MTNCQPFFWRKVKDTIRQNKKVTLQEFLFVKAVSDNKDSNRIIQMLKDQMDSIQQKLIQLETKLMRVEQNSKYTLSDPLQPLEAFKTIQQGNSTLEVKKGPDLKQNDPRRSPVLSELRNTISQ